MREYSNPNQLNFGELYYNEDRPKFIGIPIEDVKATNDILSERFKENKKAYNQLEIAANNLPISDRNKVHAQNALKTLSGTMQQTLDGGAWENATKDVDKATMDFVNDKYLKESTSDFAKEQQALSEAKKAKEDGKLDDADLNYINIMNQVDNPNAVELDQNGNRVNPLKLNTAVNKPKKEVIDFLLEVQKQVQADQVNTGLKQDSNSYLINEAIKFKTADKINKAVRAVLGTNNEYSARIEWEAKRDERMSRITKDDKGTITEKPYNLEDITKTTSNDLGYLRDIDGKFYTETTKPDLKDGKYQFDNNNQIILELDKDKKPKIFKEYIVDLNDGIAKVAKGELGQDIIENYIKGTRENMRESKEIDKYGEAMGLVGKFEERTASYHIDQIAIEKMKSQLDYNKQIAVLKFQEEQKQVQQLTTTNGSLAAGTVKLDKVNDNITLLTSQMAGLDSKSDEYKELNIQLQNEKGYKQSIIDNSYNGSSAQKLIGVLNQNTGIGVLLKRNGLDMSDIKNYFTGSDITKDKSDIIEKLFNPADKKLANDKYKVDRDIIFNSLNKDKAFNLLTTVANSIDNLTGTGRLNEYTDKNWSFTSKLRQSNINNQQRRLDESGLQIAGTFYDFNNPETGDYSGLQKTDTRTMLNSPESYAVWNGNAWVKSDSIKEINELDKTSAIYSHGTNLPQNATGKLTYTDKLGNKHQVLVKQDSNTNSANFLNQLAEGYTAAKNKGDSYRMDEYNNAYDKALAESVYGADGIKQIEQLAATPGSTGFRQVSMNFGDSKYDVKMVKGLYEFQPEIRDTNNKIIQKRTTKEGYKPIITMDMGKDAKGARITKTVDLLSINKYYDASGKLIPATYGHNQKGIYFNAQAAAGDIMKTLDINAAKLRYLQSKNLIDENYQIKNDTDPNTPTYTMTELMNFVDSSDEWTKFSSILELNEDKQNDPSWKPYRVNNQSVSASQVTRNLIP